MAWICDKNGNQKCEIKKLSYNGTFMEVSSITVTVESPEPIDFAIGDYIDWDYDGLRYTLDAAAGVEKQARKNIIGNAFVYENLVFLSPLQAANNVDFLDVVIGDTTNFLTNTEFSFYGTAWDYAKRIEANLSRLYGAGSWKVRIWTDGVCYDVAPSTIETGAWESKLVDVSNIKCLGGFQQIYDLWGCGYVFSVKDGVNYVDFYDDFELYAKTWKQGDVDKIFAYGKGNGLYKIRHTPDSDHALVTRLRAYGSSENLPANYYLNSPDYHVDGNESSELAISNLMLPVSEWTKNGIAHPSNAYLERNTDLYGVREASVAWDGSDEELGEIKPSIYGLTIQDLLDLMADGSSYRPVAAKWPDTTQRIDKIITGSSPSDNGVIAEDGFDFTVVEARGTFVSRKLESIWVYTDVDFSDLVMGATPSVGNLADYRVVPTSADVRVASFDVPDAIAEKISKITAYLTPYVGGVKIADAAFPCTISQEDISNTEGGVMYTRRYYIHLIDVTGNPIVFSTMRTGAVTYRISANIDLGGNEGGERFKVLRNEYAVSFNLLRGNRAIDKFFSVTVPQIGFDLAAAVTGNAKLCMRSGANQPREFQIVPSSARYDSSTDSWYLRCKRSWDSSLQTYFPNSNTVIAAGDEYYFSGIAMPSLYVEIAARKLLEAAKAWLKLHSKPRMLSSVDVDNKIMAKEGIVLKEGMSLPLSDTDLGISPDTQESRVIDNIRIEEGSDAIRTFSITLRDKKEKSSLDAAIRGATSDFATNTSVSDAVSAVESKDHGSLSGRDMPNQHPITAITGLEEALATFSFFEEDGSGGVKLKDEYDGFWAKGFITALGRNPKSGGGEGGGVDLARVWDSLTNNTDKPDVLINPAHIPVKLSGHVLTVGDTSINLSGNAATATKLATARTLWGQAFDGSGNVDGCLRINPSTDNFTEGIRIKPYNGWASILLGGTDLGRDYGTSPNSWSLHTYGGGFYLNRGASWEHTGYELCNIGGNWGVGTTSPASKLTVSGEATDGLALLSVVSGNTETNQWLINSLVPGLTAGQTVVGQIYGKNNSEYNAAALQYCHAGDGSASNYLGLGLYAHDSLLKVYGSGNVDVAGTISATPYSRKVTLGGGNIALDGDGGGWTNAMYHRGNGGLTWAAAGTYGFADNVAWSYYGGTSHDNAAIYITSALNVGIGTYSPLHKLDIAGTARISGLATMDGGLSVPATASIQHGSNYAVVSPRNGFKVVVVNYEEEVGTDENTLYIVRT